MNWWNIVVVIKCVYIYLFEYIYIYMVYIFWTSEYGSGLSFCDKYRAWNSRLNRFVRFANTCFLFWPHSLWFVWSDLTTSWRIFCRCLQTQQQCAVGLVRISTCITLNYVIFGKFIRSLECEWEFICLQKQF